MQVLKGLHSLICPAFSASNVSAMSWASSTLAVFGFLHCSEFTCEGKFDQNLHLGACCPLRRLLLPCHHIRESVKSTTARSYPSVCAVMALRDYLSQSPTNVNQPPVKFFQWPAFKQTNPHKPPEGQPNPCGLPETSLPPTASALEQSPQLIHSTSHWPSSILLCHP